MLLDEHLRCELGKLPTSFKVYGAQLNIIWSTRASKIYIKMVPFKYVQHTSQASKQNSVSLK